MRTRLLGLAFGAVLLVSLAASSAGAEEGRPQKERMVHRFESRAGPVFVVDEAGLRFLRFESPDGEDQTVIDPRDPAAVPMPYVRGATVAFAFLPPERPLSRALMVGLGGGAFTTLLRRLHPEAEIEAVEIDPVVVDVARRYFFVKDLEDPRFTIHVEDGAAFLARSRRRYDLIFLDAYGGDGVPEALASERFFRAARARLSPKGACVLNLAVSPKEERAILERFASAFRSCVAFRVREDENLLVVGTDHEVPPLELLRRMRSLEEAKKIPFDLLAELEPPALCSMVSP